MRNPGSRLGALTAALTVLACSAGAAGPAAVEVRPEEGAYRVGGRFATAASPGQVFDVLTDYEGIAGFVSSLESSRLLRREPQRALVEQSATARFLFVARSVKLTLEVLERRPTLVAFRDMDGRQFRRYEGAWRIEPAPGGSVVTYELLAEPHPALGPRFAARRVLAANARRLLEEVRREIERRAGGPS